MTNHESVLRRQAVETRRVRGLKIPSARSTERASLRLLRCAEAIGGQASRATIRMLPGCTSSKERLSAGRCAVDGLDAQDTNTNGRMAKSVALIFGFFGFRSSGRA